MTAVPAKAKSKAKTKSRAEVYLQQLCYTTQQTASRVVNEYTVEEMRKRADLRIISDSWGTADRRKLLEKAIAQEMYLLEASQLTLESPSILNKLARACRLATGKEFDSVHLAWEIAMVIVRDQIPFRLSPQRKLIVSVRK